MVASLANDSALFVHTFVHWAEKKSRQKTKAQGQFLDALASPDPTEVYSSDLFSQIIVIIFPQRPKSYPAAASTSAL